jgi:hypothetical protein
MSHLTRTLRCLVGACIVLFPATAVAQQCSTQPDLDTGTQNLNFDSWILNQPLVPPTAPLLPCETISWTLTVTSQVSWGSNGQFKVYNASHDLLFAVNWSAGTTATVYTIPETTDLVGSPYHNTRGIQGQPSYYDMGTYWPVTYRVTSTRAIRPGYNTGGTGFSDAPLISLPSTQYGSIHQLEPGQYYKIHLDPGHVVYAHGHATAGTNPGSALKIDLYDTSQQWVATLNYESIVGTTNFPTGSGVSTTYTNNSSSGQDLYIRLYWNPYMIRDFAITFESPKLTLFLDVNANFNPAAPVDDSPQFVPGSDLGGSSIPVQQMPQALAVYAAYVDAGGYIVAPLSASQASFELSNVSAFKGMAMNVSNPPGRNDDAPDFETTSPTVVSFDSNNVARVNLSCWDYGGWALVAVNHSGSRAELHLPVDLNGNGLPDAGWWAAGTGFDVHVPDLGQSAADDDDADPFVGGPPEVGYFGDGLTRFEEFRGFVALGSHIRTDPSKKDLFGSSNLTWTDPSDPANPYDVGIQYAFPNLPVLTHRVHGVTDPPAEFGSTNGVINGNYTNAGYPGTTPGAWNHIDQWALRARNVALIGDYAPFIGYTWPTGECNNGGLTPREVVELQIDIDKIASQSATFGYTAAQTVGAMRHTVGHEFGHGLHVSHRPYTGPQCGAGDGAPVGNGPSVMNSGLYPVDLLDPLANYNSADILQIRVIIRP